MDNYPTLCSLSQTSEISGQYFLLQQLFLKKKVTGYIPLTLCVMCKPGWSLGAPKGYYQSSLSDIPAGNSKF